MARLSWPGDWRHRNVLFLYSCVCLLTTAHAVVGKYCSMSYCWRGWKDVTRLNISVYIPGTSATARQLISWTTWFIFSKGWVALYKSTFTFFLAYWILFVDLSIEIMLSTSRARMKWCLEGLIVRYGCSLLEPVIAAALWGCTHGGSDDLVQEVITASSLLSVSVTNGSLSVASDRISRSIDVPWRVPNCITSLTCCCTVRISRSLCLTTE